MFLFAFLVIAILTGVRWSLMVTLFCITQSPLVWSFPCSYDWNLFFNFLAHVPFLGPPVDTSWLTSHPWCRGTPERPWCLSLGRVLPWSLTFPLLPARCTERQRCCWDGLSAGHTASSLRQTFGVPWSVHTVPSGCTWQRHTMMDWSRERQTSSDALGAYLNPKCWLFFSFFKVGPLLSCFASENATIPKNTKKNQKTKNLSQLKFPPLLSKSHEKSYSLFYSTFIHSLHPFFLANLASSHVCV